MKSIDYLSPKITLFYYGSRRHASNIGGVLTILMALLNACFVFYLILNIILHKITNFMHYRTYLADAGQFFFNHSTGIFHYLQLYNIKTKEYREYNSKYTRIFMSRLYRAYIDNQEKLSENEHWVYDNCREGIDNKYIDKDLFSENNSFINGACLRYYYNNKKHEYYPIEDIENFKYPYIIHGTGNKDNLFLETIIEKCENTSVTTKILGVCAKESEIDEYLEKFKGINLQLSSKRVDTDNYKKPIYQYLHSITESLDSHSVPVDNINLMPYFIEIKTGIIFPKVKKNIACSLELNRRESWDIQNNKKILAVFYYWLQNSAQVIKGGYSTIYDILPSIGGIIQLIYYIFYSLNFFYNKYVTTQDCNTSFFRMYNSEDPKGVPMKKNFERYVKSIRQEAKKYSTNKILTAIKERRDSIYIAKYNRSKKSFQATLNNNNNKILNEEKNQNDFSNSNDLIANIQNNLINNSCNMNTKQNKFPGSKKNFKFNANKSKNDEFISFIECENKSNINNSFSDKLNDFINQKNKTFKVEPLNVKITSKFINCLNFLLYMLKFKKRSKMFFVLNQFRQKLLGEEHIFRNNIILYHLEKYFNIKEIQKVDILELFENL